MHENQTADASCFLTLTYDDEHLPPNNSLELEHWQKFIRSLRKRLGKKLRYYHCGEYGEVTKRPHYHAILYGHDFSDDRRKHSRPDGNWLYVSDTLGAAWPYGHSLLGDVSFESAQYVAGYCTKKLTGELADAEYVDVETGEVLRRAPYATMSRRPGIGDAWYQKYGSQVYPRDEVIVNGHVTQPPKFYDGRLAETDPTLYMKIKADRENRPRNPEDETLDRLAVRERVATLNLTRRDNV